MLLPNIRLISETGRILNEKPLSPDTNTVKRLQITANQY